jgi:hypothetical protein
MNAFVHAAMPRAPGTGGHPAGSLAQWLAMVAWLPGLAVPLVLLIATAACAQDDQPDRLAFGNVLPGEEWGVLIDGTTDSGPVDDRIATGTGAELVLENFRPGSESEGEVIALTRGRALELLENVPFTQATGDLVQIEFGPAIEIPLTVWIVEGPLDDGSLRAFDQLAEVAGLWRQERMGLRLGKVELVDATGNDKAGFYREFDCSERSEVEQVIGSRPGRINVYLVETVNGSPFAADACAFGSGFAALGRSAGSDLLVHELGHSLSLRHTDGIAGLGEENVMASFSTSRQFLTEGQVIRAHLDPSSVVNSLYAARPGKPVRSCPHEAVSASCPPLTTRIWPDALPVDNP